MHAGTSLVITMPYQARARNVVENCHHGSVMPARTPEILPG